MSEQEYFDVSILKTPPSSIEAEQSVIGGLLIGGDFDAIADIVSDADFFHPQHRWIFGRMAQLSAAGTPIDLITVADSMSAEEMDRIGGFAYMAEIAKNTPSTANLRAYAAAVKDKSNRRALIMVGGEITELGFEEGDQTSADLIDDAQRRVMELGDKGDVSTDLHVESVLRHYIEEVDRRSQCEGLAGLATGFADIDARTNGFSPADLVIIAGRPASGKTTLAMNIVEHAAIIEKKAVLVFSMEMSRLQLMDRMVASVGKIPFSLLRSGKIFNSEHEYKFIPAASRIKSAPIYIDDRGALTVQQMRTTARRLHKKTPLSLIVVDYLQLARAKGENRVNEITAISQGLKALAKELAIPVIALSQLSRKCEEQKRKPISSDLRDSGSIEQDADSIFLIYRDEVYNPDNQETKGLAEIICTKLRNGEPGSDYLQSDLAMCKFQNRELRYTPQDEPQQSSKRGFEY